MTKFPHSAWKLSTACTLGAFVGKESHFKIYAYAPSGQFPIIISFLTLGVLIGLVTNGGARLPFLACCFERRRPAFAERVPIYVHTYFIRRLAAECAMFSVAETHRTLTSNLHVKFYIVVIIIYPIATLVSSCNLITGSSISFSLRNCCSVFQFQSQ